MPEPKPAAAPAAENARAKAPAPQAPTTFRVSIDEACARISAGDGRVELISAFHSEERAAGRLRDTEDAYRSRFAAFAARPA